MRHIAIRSANRVWIRPYIQGTRLTPSSRLNRSFRTYSMGMGGFADFRLMPWSISGDHALYATRTVNGSGSPYL